MIEKVAGRKECVKQRTVGSGPQSVIETWCGALVDAVGEAGEHHGEDRGKVITWQRSGAGKNKGEWGKALP